MKRNLITNSFLIRGSDNIAKTLVDSLFQYDEDGKVVHNPTEEEKWGIIRKVRNELLAMTDWIENPSNALSIDERVLWGEYRQKLRDIPQDYLTPEEVVFPQEPK